MLERKSAKDRKNSVSIPVNERYLPELFEPSYLDEEKDVQAILEKCEEEGFLSIRYKDRWNGLPLYKRKASIIFNDATEQQSREILGVYPNNEKNLWLDSVSNSDLPMDIKNILLDSAPIQILNRSFDEIVERLEKFVNLSEKTYFIRQASAWMFWGSSKILDNRVDLASTLGLKQPPIQINIHLSSEKKDKVLFIENSQTFEYAKSSLVFKDFTLIYMSGYMGTAKRTRTKDGSSLYFSQDGSLDKNSIKMFLSWFYDYTDCEVYLWGDFDYEGIHIYLSLKKVFQEVKLWEPAYSKMIEAAKSEGHSIAEAKKGQQVEPNKTGNSYIDDKILPAMKEYGFFDQEGILL